MFQGHRNSRVRTAMIAGGARVSARLTALRGNDRGDVPGWVLVTMMTAGLVIILWGTAGGLLSQLFTDAVQGVKGP